MATLFAPGMIRACAGCSFWLVTILRSAYSFSQPAIQSRHDVSICLPTSLCLLITTKLFSIPQLMAPFTPFLTEHMYQNLAKVLPADQV
jgi:hypothetical protein